jgi:ferredoxin
MLEAYLRTVDSLWPVALRNLASRIHPVDAEATRIWFSLYPLLIHVPSEATADRAAFELFYQLRGSYRLAERVHSSHRFLYGHRYWASAREAVLRAAPGATLEETIVAAAGQVEAPEALAVGITAIALMTLRQAPEALRETSPAALEFLQESPEAWLARRAKDAKAGFFSRARPRIVFDEQSSEGAFPLHPTQDITMAAANDKRPYHLTDSRCFEEMGPIPVECRSGSCGTCWIGVLGGNEHLSPVTPYERKRMEYLGYWDSGFEDPSADRPLIRLACQTQASGSASIIIPSWCGVFGAVRRERA